MEAYAAGWLSILPPVIAIALALITKEVFSSLLLGIFSGTLIYTFGKGIDDPLIKSVEVTFNLMGDKVDFNILLFCTMLGALVYILNMSGGTRVYGEIARKKIKSRKSSVMATCGLSFFIFIDDYFNCLTVGTVMRPLTDAYRVSREKLSYIVDSTAAPLCIIAPVSSWAAAVGSSLKSTGAFESDFAAFIATIPYNFYALFSLMLVVYISYTNRDFGPMKLAEERAVMSRAEEVVTQNVERSKHAQSAHGTVWDMIIPLMALIIFAVLGLLYDGGYWGSDAAYHTITAALGNCSASKALVWASFGALVVAFILYIPRRIVKFSDFMEGTIEGMKVMLPANIILVLAWTLSGVCRDLLLTQHFVEGFVAGSTGLDIFLPVVIFMIAAFLSFSTGTAWGTFGILIPIAVPVAQAVDPSLTIVSLSATLAGAVFGDHCSPISDTTILSSAGCSCQHVAHVSTQIPYAWFVAICCAVGYLVAGMTKGSWIMSFGATFLTFAVVLAVMWKYSFNIHKYENELRKEGLTA